MPHERAGTAPRPEDLTDIPALIAAYSSDAPDPSEPDQRVVFGTSGHRGSAFDRAFNEAHILAITQAIVEYRQHADITGPLYIARDTHALSEPAMITALEVLIANDVTVLVDSRGGYTPTPALSRAVIAHNRTTGTKLADGIVITPSHNPPRDGGFKYNPPHGGPAGSEITSAIAARANELLEAGVGTIARTPVSSVRDDRTTGFDFLGAYVDDLPGIVDLAAIRDSGLHIGADPMGGAAVDYWGVIAERHHLNLEVVNTVVDPAFAFMPLDTDGKIRMDCSSADSMAALVHNRDHFDLATGNDTDADRHGIVTPDGGLMNPNHYLAVSIDYLFEHRTAWPEKAAVGKTVVSSSMIDRVAAHQGRELVEVPVGFKWFVPGLSDGVLGFGGEESAGASFLCFDGTVWSTDKDGLIMDLLAAEITAITGETPSKRYEALSRTHGAPVYARSDAPASREDKKALSQLTPDDIAADTVAGDKITARITEAPGNGAPIGGLKVTTHNAWFAVRPSGTEEKYKIYAESFLGNDHLSEVEDEARGIVEAALNKG